MPEVKDNLAFVRSLLTEQFEGCRIETFEDPAKQTHSFRIECGQSGKRYDLTFTHRCLHDLPRPEMRRRISELCGELSAYDRADVVIRLSGPFDFKDWSPR